MPKREILIGVSGGVAAYKAADLVSQCVQAGHAVTVVMTPSALRFIGTTTFEALTGRPAYVDMFDPKEHFRGEHIGLAQRAELLCIAPATANCIARIAHGMADDLLSTVILACECPVLLAPAMNCQMWAKPAVQRNVETVRDDGYELIDPESGWLSCGQTGPGRMADVATIVERIQSRLVALK